MYIRTDFVSRRTKIKIKSRFKDYYDHVAYQYGGGDPKIVYNRNRLKPLTVYGDLKYDGGIDIEACPKRALYILSPGERYYNNLSSYQFKYLCIVGKWYLLVKAIWEDEFSVLNKDKHQEIFEDLFPKRHRYGQEGKTFDYYVGCEDPELIEISRTLNTPVFCIEGYSWIWKEKKHLVHIEGAIPTLGNLGVPAIYPAEQIYQDIAYFIGNKIHKSPDLSVPVQVGNADKIKQAGFDLKTSFRPKMKRK